MDDVVIRYRAQRKDRPGKYECESDVWVSVVSIYIYPEEATRSSHNFHSHPGQGRKDYDYELIGPWIHKSPKSHNRTNCREDHGEAIALRQCLHSFTGRCTKASVLSNLRLRSSGVIVVEAWKGVHPLRELRVEAKQLSYFQRRMIGTLDKKDEAGRRRR